MPKPPFKAIVAQAEASLAKVASLAELEVWQTQYLGRKGELTTALRSVGSASVTERQALGHAGNHAKEALQQMLIDARARLASQHTRPPIDITLPGTVPELGSRHPVSLVMDELVEIFTAMGFSVAEGPEVEDDWHNFQALNMGPDHPARDMQDTFYVAGSEDSAGNYRLLPRTHTSGVQIRTMENQPPPVRIIAPGLVYRNETEDATHSAVFQQLEGLMVDETTTFSDLKGILLLMARRLLGDDVQIRFRPSFFPYTEPSAEVDVSSPRVRDGAWIELGGSGMVHPEVLKGVGYAENIRGFAFGLGPARIAMIKYGLQDLRPFFRPDLRILEQFV